MNRILGMIQLLLAMNTIKVRRDRDFMENLLNLMRSQNQYIEKLKAMAIQEGTLLGRIVTFPAGDSKCVYVITKIFPRTVQIDWVNYGDGYSDARVGHQALIDTEFAIAMVALEEQRTMNYPKAKIICPTITARPEVLQKFQS